MDDDLLLNFSSSNKNQATPRPKVKGTWKDKRQALKQHKRTTYRPVSEKVSKTPAPKDVSTGINSQPIKQSRLPPQDFVKPHKIEGSAATVSRSRLGEKNTVLSSLFTSNAEIQVREKSKAQNFEIENAPLGDGTFSGLGVPDNMNTLLQSKMTITNPTKIQRASIPQLLNYERDAFIVAQTGSGKTLAYLLPVLSRIMSQPDLSRTSGVFAVILAPTRELATQIYQSLEELVKCCHWIVPGIVIGGEKKKSEKARLRKGVNILVGTPGRLADHFDNTQSLDLSQVRWVILDEGDRLVELGFEETLSKILEKIQQTSAIKSSRFKQLPPERTNILCSATMNASVERLKTITLTNPIWIRSDTDQESENAPSQLVQSYVIVPPKLRMVSLAAELKVASNGKTMVFVSCSDAVDFYYKVFTHVDQDEEDSDDEDAQTGLPSNNMEGVTIFKLHGSMTQQQRSTTVQAFSTAKRAVLFCTDVASRGLDVQVDAVVEYDPPFAVEDHIHRVGRTARAGAAGSALLFLQTGQEEGYVAKIEAIHQGQLKQKTYQKLLERGFGRKWDMEATTWQLNVERWLLEDDDSLDTAKKAYSSHIRAYTTHISTEKDIFNVKTLHLGHLAKSFALREVPSAIKSSGSAKPRQKKRTGKNAMMDVARRHMAMGEYNIA